jgi:hypothetical protein
MIPREMRDSRTSGALVKTLNPIIDYSICLGQSSMLEQVFIPGIHNESLDELIAPTAII